MTAGKKGSYLYCKNSNKLLFCPALASKIVDKVGAGDTMLSFFSLAIAANKKTQILHYF